MNSSFIALPYGFQQFTQAMVATNRIMTFLSMEEISSYLLLLSLTLRTYYRNFATAYSLLVNSKCTLCHDRSSLFETNLLYTDRAKICYRFFCQHSFVWLHLLFVIKPCVLVARLI